MENIECRSLSLSNKKYCKICGDVSPRKYYGVLACNGCKSFFRRALRGKKVYKCRFDRKCIVSKDKRTQCRQCRLKKCVEAGMRREAIYDGRELRDPGRYHKPVEDKNLNGLTFNILIHADDLVKGSSRITLGYEMLAAGDEFLTNEKSLATVKDHYDSLREQLLVMVQWAQSIPVFCELPKEDKVALFQASAAELTIMTLVRRSIPLTNVLLMGNGYLLVRELDVLCVIGQIIDELVIPFKELNVDDTEFALLKAILFFDPSARGLSDKKKIQTLRRQAQSLLEGYIMDRPLESYGRLSEILIRLLPLQSTAKAMSEQIFYRKFFGIADIDKLLREMILGEDISSDNFFIYEDQEQYTSRSTVITTT